MSEPSLIAEQAVSAFNEGVQAYNDGYSDDVNPYQFGTSLFDEWEQGWDHEFNKHYREWQSDERDKQMINRRT